MKGHFEGDITIDMVKNVFEIRNFKYDFEGTEKETQMAYDFTEKSFKYFERFGMRARERHLGCNHSLYPTRKIENGDGLIVIDDEKKVEKVLEVADDVQSTKKKLDKMVEDANKRINEYFNRAAYDRLVYKLKSNDVLYVRMKDLFGNKKFINNIATCVESGKFLHQVKKALRYLMQFVMLVPDFVFGNMGKIYDDSDDKSNDKLWGYLKMINKYFFKKTEETEGCIEMAKRIYSLMLDAIGEATPAHEDKWEDDNWD